MVDIIMTSLASFTISLYLRCATVMSVTTSGRGPSSLNDPAKTNGTLFLLRSVSVEGDNLLLYNNPNNIIGKMINKNVLNAKWV